MAGGSSTGETVAAAVWRISPTLVHALDERLGIPVDSYVNGSQTWLVDLDEPGEADEPRPAAGRTLEVRLHPVARYRTPAGASHYDVWEQVVGGLAAGADAAALPVGDERRPLDGLWAGLEVFVAFGDDVEPQTLRTVASALLGVEPDAVGLVDHQRIGDAWEASGGGVSIVDLLLAQLAPPGSG